MIGIKNEYINQFDSDLIIMETEMSLCHRERSEVIVETLQPAYFLTITDSEP